MKQTIFIFYCKCTVSKREHCFIVRLSEVILINVNKKICLTFILLFSIIIKLLKTLTLFLYFTFCVATCLETHKNGDSAGKSNFLRW